MKPVSRTGASRGRWLSDTHRTDRAAPMEITRLLGPKRSFLAGLVKFLAVGCGLNEIAGGLRPSG
jgi:hypothetical protein